jgi:purine-cytosine permease-like protein
MRRAILFAHILCSVALLGDVAGFFAVAVRAASTDDPALYDVLEMFSLFFGIPLSFGALISGVALTRVTKWGVRKHRWVLAKLVVIVSVILMGAFVLGPSTVAARDGDEAAQLALLLGSGYDVLALSLATGLSVYKPRLRSRRKVLA